MTVAAGDARPTRGARAASRAALDVMLTDAAIEPGARRLVQPVATARLSGALARRPRRVARRLGGIGAELTRIAVGRSDIAPRKGDRRFGDRAWNDSWMFHRLMQTYLALGGAVGDLVDDARLDWRTDLRARFVLDNLLDAIAPTNFPLTNPQVLKETIERGGGNLVTGGLRFARDAAAAACRRWSTRAASRSAATSR